MTTTKNLYYDGTGQVIETEVCDACGAEIGEPCRPTCIGKAAHDEATAAAEKELARIAKRQALGEDADYADGCVLTWHRTYHNSPKVYTYAAVRVDGEWWVTGTTVLPMPWSALVDVFLIHADTVAYCPTKTQVWPA